MKKLKIIILLSLVCFIARFNMACGGGTAPFVGTPGVIVLPTTVTLGPSQTQEFQATIVYTTTTVIWTVDGGDANGTVDQNGNYTAPATITENTNAVVRASLANNTSTQDTSEIDLTPTPPAP